MSVDINCVRPQYVVPQYGIALNKKEMIYFLLHVKYSNELFPYVNCQQFEEMKKKLLTENGKVEYNINDFLKDINDSLFDSEIVYYEKQFSLYIGYRNVVFLSMNGQEDDEHYYFSMFLLCDNKIDYRNLSFGYANQLEMINELKKKYADALPEDFNWEFHLGFVFGTYSIS